MLTLEEKAAAFDALADALTNYWADGREGGPWSWWPPNPSGGPRRQTKAEAVQTLVEWAVSFGPRWAAKNARLAPRRIELPLVEVA